MATVAAPYGMRPVNMIGGQSVSHGIRMMRIATAYASHIFYGDPVDLDAAGFITRQVEATDVVTSVGNMPIGVFLGCEYEVSSQGLLHRQMWTAGTITAPNKSIWGYVCDDPSMLFEMQSSGIINQSAIGLNAAFILGTATGGTPTGGNLATGNSRVSITAAPAVTATMPIRIVDAVERPGSTLGDAFTDVVVRFNNHRHIHTTAF